MQGASAEEHEIESNFFASNYHKQGSNFHVVLR